MIYVYRRPSSTGARELVNALMNAGIPAKRWSDRFTRLPQTADKIICWGEASPVNTAANAPQVLNGAPLKSKFEQAQILSQAGIPTVEVSRTRPAQVELPTQDPARPIFNRITQQLEEFIEAEMSRTLPYREALSALTVNFNRLNEALAIPVSVIQPVEWLARRNNHVGGDDLLNSTLTANGGAQYWSKKEDIVEEYRIHSFCGKSIRAGKKAPREGFQTPHPWIRSFDGGWRIVYDSYESSREQRDLASRACTALGLEFGAVDLGRRRDNSLVIFEVNRAPGLEGGTVNAYVQAIQKWLRGEITERRAA